VPAYRGPLYVESLARYLHNRSNIGRYVAWEALPPEAHDGYISDARQMAAVLIRDVASEVRNHEKKG
jgi:hypothetical protein